MQPDLRDRDKASMLSIENSDGVAVEGVAEGVTLDNCLSSSPWRTAVASQLPRGGLGARSRLSPMPCKGWSCRQVRSSLTGRAIAPALRRLARPFAAGAACDRGSKRLPAAGVGPCPGLETRLSVVVDAFVPIAPLIRALAAFRAAFPLIDVSISRQSLDATVRALREGHATLA